MLKIGNVTMNNNVVLAPMAGVCNPAFRLIAKEFGCGLVCAEMVSDKAILHGNQRTLEMLFVDEREKPLSLQIFGGDKESLVEAVKFVDQNTNADIIDINMGCPVPKVTNATRRGRGQEACDSQNAHRVGRRAYLRGGERPGGGAGRRRGRQRARKNA
jgi:tRNA-dihydrouridine synthase